MSIAPVQKVTVFGLLEEKETVLGELQALGCLHVVPLAAAPRQPELVPPEHPEAAIGALRYLLEAPARRRSAREDLAFDLELVVEQVRAVQRRTRAAVDRRDDLLEHLRHAEPWGHFKLPEPGEFDGLRLWFYIVPRHELDAFCTSGMVYQVVHSDRRGVYVVVLSEGEPPRSQIAFARSHVGDEPLGSLRGQLHEVEVDLEDLAAERLSLTRWIDGIGRHLAVAEDCAALRHVASKTLDDRTAGGSVFALGGWVARAELPALRELVERRRLGLVVEDPSADDLPPTLLVNSPTVEAGQHIVSFYSQPGYRTWDPSAVIFLSFPVFFAMILADAGYALVMSVLLALGWRRLGRSSALRSLRPLALLVLASSLAYGVLAGSYFGVTPGGEGAAGHFLAGLKRLDVADFETMMQLAIVIGAAHVSLANGVRAWRERGRPRAIASLGWVVAIGGALGLWLGSMHDSAALTDGGMVATGVGLAMVFGFSSDRRVRGPRDLAWRALDGLLGLTGITRAFGDVLSYLRLFALGLASASLALTFNDLAADIRASAPGIGLLLAMLVLVLGHTLNLLLAVVSGVVHGLRLNLIEFFGWGIAEEGHAFRRFSKKGV